MMERSEEKKNGGESVLRRGKRDLRFARLEKTSFPKTRRSLEAKFLKMENEEKE